MPQNHKVKQGECLSSIAKKYGFIDYRIIYDYGENAAFKQKRPNPNIIFPGDVIVIPDHDVKELSKPTEQTHNFVLDAHPVKLRLVVKDDEDKPLANMKYELKVGDATFNGTTDGSGKIEQVIQADDTTAELVLSSAEGENQNVVGIFKLELGHLDPVEEASGVQARLNNLGYDCGKVDGIIGPKTQEAISHFQSQNGLPETGHADAATKNKLKQLHDWE
jgi:N-acetylmuramoyl-L-alanine amidase